MSAKPDTKKPAPGNVSPSGERASTESSVTQRDQKQPDAHLGSFEQSVPREGDDARSRADAPDSLSPSTSHSTPDR